MASGLKRRDIFKFAGAMGVLGARTAFSPAAAAAGASSCGEDVAFLPVTPAEVPIPKNIGFRVRHGAKPPITLAGHYWQSAAAAKAGKPLPAILELNPYRRRDGLLYADSMMYPWFAANGYLCFRVDLQGSGDSEGILTDEYTDEELAYCVQVIEEIAKLPFCDGHVGMMGKSWSAINSLMVAAREDCPAALKAIVVCCGSDDRYDDDVHYMGGAMMLDNVEWPSSMWGWLTLPPDPAVVGEAWQAMWRQRIEEMSFWFERWAAHQTRDAYWSATSIRGRYDKVKVPVFILSGWQDGYKNPVERVVAALGRLGKPVAGLIGPWGHNYPFAAYPGPRIDWLRYVTEQWWDRWLKGKPADPKAAWPELAVWLGHSRAPERDPSFDDAGEWVAEDHDWRSRARDAVFHLAPDHRLTPRAAAATAVYVSPADLTLGTAMLETSSWGACGNGDLPGDQSADDRRSIHFDSAPLTEDLAVFGYPTAMLALQCDEPRAVVAIRLSEVDPATGKSHLVSYRFFNLCYRDADMAEPQPTPRQRFARRIPLNITGHVFKRGWVVRLSISPALFPTLWQSAGMPALKLATGAGEGLPESTLTLPVRPARAADQNLPALLRTPRTSYVDPAQYVPTLKTLRAGSALRKARPVTIGGRPGMEVTKRFDSGRSILGGALDHLLIDQVTEERIRITAGEPRSMAFSGRMRSGLARGAWQARAETETRVWSEGTTPEKTVFRYEARVRAFAGEKLIAQRSVSGAVPRRWV
jgi:uncharacterized protein